MHIRSLLLPAIAFTCFYNLTAFAVNYPMPVGHQEAFLGNTGTAMEASPGNVIYNPAGLAFLNLKDMNLTISGNALEQQRFELDGLNLDDGDKSSVNIRPMLAASTFPVESGYLSLFVANPVSFSIIQGQNSVTSGITTKATFNLQVDGILAGIAYADLITADLSWGITGGVTYTTKDYHIYRTATGSGTAVTVFVDDRTKETRFYLNPGILWQATPDWSLGASVQVIPFTLISDGNYFSAMTNSSTPTTIDQTSTQYNPSSGTAYVASVGQQLVLQKQHLYLDITYTSSYTQKDHTGVESNTAESWTYSAGWKSKTNPKWQPMAGFSYSDLRTSENYLTTLGMLLQQRKSELALGAYYSKNNPKQDGSSPFTGVGVMFSSNVEY